MSELPSSWAKVNLGGVAEFEMGQAPPGTACNTEGHGTVFVKAGEFGPDFPIVREWTTQPLKFARKGDVLICVVGATSGKLNLGIDCAIGRSVAAIRPTPAIGQSVLYRQLQLQVEQLRADSTGTAQGVISKQMLADIQVAVPPLAEQTRIADQLDTLLARIKACNDHLGAIPGLLKRFRQAVLNAALAGLLDESEEETTCHQLRISDIAAVGTGSTPLRSNGSFYASTGTPWVTSAATSAAYVTSVDQFVTPAAIAAHRLKVYSKGTLLVAMYGEGKTRGQVSELGFDATINQACAAISVDESRALRAFIKIALAANYLAMRELAEGGNQPNLNLSKIQDFKIPLPPLDVQAEVVKRTNDLWAMADRIEAQYGAARSHAHQLAPQVLAKAFRGELVPQDPNDEPASALLARLAAERSQVGVASKAHQARTRRATPSPKPSASARNTMSNKSRQDKDVKSQPYLADHLRRLGQPVDAKTLYDASELPVADFYKQLAWEIAQGHVNDAHALLEPAHHAA